MTRRKRYTPFEKVKVIYRKENNGNVIAFLPELSANIGNIVCYAHTGQHGEASLEYYHDTAEATPAEYAELHNELRSVYRDCELSIKRRLYYADLTGKAWKRSE